MAGEHEQVGATGLPEERDPMRNSTPGPSPGEGGTQEGGEEYRQLAEARQLAEERAHLLRQRDAELAEVRRLAEERQGQLEALQQAQLAAHRRALLAEHRGQVVEDLVQGESVEALDASVAQARTAYQAVAEQVRREAQAGVPASNPARQEPDLSQLSPQDKIAEALRRRKY
jgi:hypothetical protein